MLVLCCRTFILFTNIYDHELYMLNVNIKLLFCSVQQFYLLKCKLSDWIPINKTNRSLTALQNIASFHTKRGQQTRWKYTPSQFKFRQNQKSQPCSQWWKRLSLIPTPTSLCTFFSEYQSVDTLEIILNKLILPCDMKSTHSTVSQPLCSLTFNLKMSSSSDDERNKLLGTACFDYTIAGWWKKHHQLKFNNKTFVKAIPSMTLRLLFHLFVWGTTLYNFMSALPIG